MTEIIYNGIKELINELAQSLGVAGEYVFDELVKYQLYSGILYFIVNASILIVSVVVVVKTMRAFIKAEYDIKETYYSKIKLPSNVYAKYISLGDGTVSWIILGLAIVFATIAIISIPSDVLKILNPEYYAIVKLIESIGG